MVLVRISDEDSTEPIIGCLGRRSHTGLSTQPCSCVLSGAFELLACWFDWRGDGLTFGCGLDLLVRPIPFTSVFMNLFQGSFPGGGCGDSGPSALSIGHLFSHILLCASSVTLKTLVL